MTLCSLEYLVCLLQLNGGQDLTISFQISQSFDQMIPSGNQLYIILYLNKITRNSGDNEDILVSTVTLLPQLGTFQECLDGCLSMVENYYGKFNNYDNTTYITENYACWYPRESGILIVSRQHFMGGPYFRLCSSSVYPSGCLVSEIKFTNCLDWFVIFYRGVYHIKILDKFDIDLCVTVLNFDICQ